MYRWRVLMGLYWPPGAPLRRLKGFLNSKWIGEWRETKDGPYFRWRDAVEMERIAEKIRRTTCRNRNEPSQTRQ